MVTSELYTDGRYLELHPTWHSEDSKWKAMQVERMLLKNDLRPASVTEVGCGAGGILAELQGSLGGACRLRGFEISPQAYELAQTRGNRNLEFILGDYLAFGNTERVDLILAMDVVEHIPDYMGFLEGLVGRAELLIFHVPLDLSLQSVARRTPEKVRKSAGHLHYFTKDLFLMAIEDAGYQVLDWSYTGAAIDMPASSFAMAVAKGPRRALYAISPDLAARVLGGFSLLVLAKAKSKDGGMG